MAVKTSRLYRSSQKNVKNQIVFFTIAIILLLFILFEFGPFVLNGLSGVLGFGKNTETNTIKEKSSLEPPFFTSIPEATDNAVIQIMGTSTYSDAVVELYVNGELYDTTPLTNDQKFAFETVELTEGNNTINARVKKDNSYSDETRSYIVVYTKGDPKLEVSFPADGQEFKMGDQTIYVQGKTGPENTVNINGFRAIVNDEGNFTYNLNLKDGDNEIKVEAVSPGGSKTEKTLKVKYTP